MIKKIDGISKTLYSNNNLTERQKYQTGFVIFDAESNFEHIHPVFTLLSFFSFVRKLTTLIDRLGDPYVDNHQFFYVPRSPHQNFDCVNETIHFSAFTVLDIKLLMSILLTI